MPIGEGLASICLPAPTTRGVGGGLKEEDPVLWREAKSVQDAPRTGAMRKAASLGGGGGDLTDFGPKSGLRQRDEPPAPASCCTAQGRGAVRESTTCAEGVDVDGQD